ncbi:PorT family protein [Muricauda oceani]|uniref:PorT family protein n=1 Tax=Flagellimonas oceani TaxID=2698672 RepID=A0A6G7J038_9FLAO|nr:porin family protein [Allomuricauda oceani]MBW8243634.1 PorT family protein [Allomuricauda oceani]QII43999.1 PorT family protein [Allomuricauda oceani]
MKKHFLTIAALLAAITTYSQTKPIEFGLRGGLNFSSVINEDESIESPKGRANFYGGFLMEAHLNDWFSLQPELFYSAQGFDLDGDLNNFDAEFQVDYLQLPVLAKVYIIKGLSIQAGPQFGLKINEEADFDLFEEGGDIGTDAFNDFDLQLTGGAAYTFGFGFFVEARATLGLTEVIDDSEAHNIVFAAGIGYLF